MENRFGLSMEPAFHKDRIDDFKKKAGKLPKGTKIFVGSSADMWGDWVPKEWIDAVLAVCSQYKGLEFQFLTKNPKRYIEFRIPSNCIRGITVDTNKRVFEYEDNCIHIDFISFEPLLEKLEYKTLFLIKYSDAQWIIIGGDSTPGAAKPPDEWADEIIDWVRMDDMRVWVKDNYKYHTKIKEHIGGKK
ncbi:unnamed protein product [marine sediment metagenome]|uniref:Uncharacterized protein n=1 Tax=marine sediment metagenome TaxID=412755 RepID=X0YTT0_9ZZZZ